MKAQLSAGTLGDHWQPATVLGSTLIQTVS